MRGIASVRTSASFAFVLITVAVSAHTFSGRGRALLPSFLSGDEEVCSVGRTSLSKSLDSGEYAEAETSGVEAIQRAAPDIETSGAVLSEEEARFVKSSAKKYIVRFTSYKMQNEHKKTLERILGKKSGSSVTLADDEIDDTLTSNVRPVEHMILDRKNRAEAFPTDFALVTSRNEAALIALLAEPLARTLGVVRDCLYCYLAGVGVVLLLVVRESSKIFSLYYTKTFSCSQPRGTLARLSRRPGATLSRRLLKPGGCRCRRRNPSPAL